MFYVYGEIKMVTVSP